MQARKPDDGFIPSSPPRVTAARDLTGLEEPVALHLA